MVAVTSGRVLITGANGFIGAWTVKAFLDAGFTVRAAIRDESKATHLRNTFSSYGESLEFAVIPDITKDGAFDEAIMGIHVVVHTASPVTLSADDPEDLIVPAVKGTLGVLHAANKCPLVKRIVFLSSCATVLDPLVTGPRVYDETCWNKGSVGEVEQKGRAASQLSKYRASKVHAERCAWEFFERSRAEQAGWDLVVLNPPWVFGPVMHEVRGGPEGLNGSNKFWYDAVINGKFDTTMDHAWIDVRDLAHALLLSVTTPDAGGERMIVAAGEFRWQDFILTASKFSNKVHALNGPYDPEAVHTARQNVSKAKGILGITYRNMEKTAGDILNQYESSGWL